MKQKSDTLLVITLGTSFILLLSGCGSRKTTLVRKISLSPEHKQQATLDSQSFVDDYTPIITVWIHGTRFFSPSIFHEAFGGEASLKSVNDIEFHYSVHTSTDTICSSAPDRCPKDNMYIFGWSGRLSFEARKEAACALYAELKRLVLEYYQKYTVLPKIRIIAHSHGGNVALNLAKVKPKDHVNFFISELILLACPVQTQTASLIKDSLFQRAYSLYSQLDLVQILDPQGLYWDYPGEFIFSQRCFPTHEKIAQVKIKFNGRALLHTEFVHPRFLKYVFTIIDEINQWQQEEGQFSSAWNHMNKVLCLYTNGRKIYPERYAHENIAKMEVYDQRTYHTHA